MGSRGAIYSYNYVIDGVESAISPRAVPPGKQVTLKLEVYNGSSPAGLVVGKITQNDEVCRYGYKKNLPPGTSDKFDIDCSFVMGSNDIQVDYYAYHEYDGSPDAHRVIKFTAAAAQTCTQYVLVRKKDTSNVYLKGVTVEAHPTTTGAVVRGVTGSDGRCRLTLIKSKVYNISISPSSSYMCEYNHDCETRGVTACGGEIAFYFSPRGAGICDQDVTVALSDGGTQRVALDWGDGTTDYGNPPKTFRHSYTVGTAATIKATASGYEPASEYLIACRATIRLVLHKSGMPPVTPPYTPPVTPPVQEPPPATGGRWKRDAFRVGWVGNTVVINYEMENAVQTALSGSPGRCRYEYYGIAKSGTKTIEGTHINSFCADKKYTGTVKPFWSVTPGMSIPVDLTVHDLQLRTRGVIDTFIVTVPEKEVPVGNKITVTVGHSFDITKTNTIKCGEVVPLPVQIPPGQTAWIPKPIGYEVCKKNIPSNRIVEFTAADGLVEGHHYVFTIYPITWLDQALNDQVFEFKGAKTGTMENVTFIHKPICNLLGIPPESEECKDEVGEFLDPIYAYNTLNKILYHRDMHGNPAEPEMLDYVILPMVFAGSLVPMPVGKGTKLLAQLSGDLAKHANTASKKLWLKMHQKAIHQLAAVGDSVNLRTFMDNFRIGNLPQCESLLKQAAEVAGRSEPSRKLMRTNLGKWVRGLRAKWKTTPSLKTKLDDLEKGADGNIFKSFESTISAHFDDAAKAGDWKKAHEIYHSAAMSVDDMTYLEHNLVKFTPEFRRMHNIMRYGNDDFIKFLKTDRAAVPEFANRFDEGVEFIIRHIGEETGQEVGAYKVILDALPESEVAAIVRNLSGAGKSAAAAVTHVLKADATRGMGVFYETAAKGIKGTAKLSKKEQKAVAASLRTKMDDAAKTMTPKETAAVEKLLETDDVVKHPKLGRLWNYIHGKEGTERFRDLPIWKKAAMVGAGFLVVSEVWKRTMDFCMALFIGEETIQWAGFGGIVLNSLTYDWAEKSLSEKKKLIEIFEEFRDKRVAIHDMVTTGAGLFETLCVIFGQIYRNFWEADAISLWALDQKIEDMKRGIDPLSGLGDCTLIAQADKSGVAFYVHGETQKYYSGAAFSKVYIPKVIVRNDPYKVVLCAEKDGYVSPLMQPIRITEDDLGDKVSTPLFNMVPDAEAGPDPFDGRPYTDAEYNALAEKPDVVRFGKIICSTSPAGAKIYLDGVYKNALTNWTLEYVPLGSHTVVFKKDGYADCTVNVIVVVEPDTQAYCTFEGVEGAISFKCAHNDDYCTRGATVFYRKEGASAWEEFGKKTSSYAVTKTGLEAGVYEVRYNLLNAMECQGKVTVRAGETVDFDKQLRSRLPKTVRTTVTAIVDGDSIRTAYTDNLSEFPPPATKYTHQEIRIIGYNSEECEDFPSICAPGGKEAGERLKELIPVGTDIELRIYEWYPLGANNRIIAGIFKNGRDMAIEMLRSCLVTITEAKYQSAYPWIKWEGENSYDEAWCDPTKTNVTISTSDAYGASMNVDVIMFDNEMKGSAEGGVTIKSVRAGTHTVEIRDDILEDQKLWAFVQPLNKAFKVPCIFEIDVQPGETYRVRVQLGLKEEQLPTAPTTPPVTPSDTLTVTADSAIPLWIWDEDGEERLPCTRFNAMAGGTAFGIAVCKGGYDKMATLIIPHTHIVPPFTMPFDITLSDRSTPAHLHGRYTGTVYIDGGKGKVHVKLTSYPTPPPTPPVTPLYTPPVTPPATAEITKAELISEWGTRGAIDLSRVSTVSAANKWYMYYRKLNYHTANFEKVIEISNLQTRNPPTQVSDIALTENKKRVQELDRAWVLARLDELVYDLAQSPIVPLTGVHRRITFSTSPSLVKIYVDGLLSTAKTIHIKTGKHRITFAAINYDTLNVEINVSSDAIECLTKAVCGYKTEKPYIMVAKDYIRAYLKPVVTASSFSHWLQMKGGGEGICLDDVIVIVQAYKAKKDIGFKPTLDNLIDVVRYYKLGRPS